MLFTFARRWTVLTLLLLLALVAAACGGGDEPTEAAGGGGEPSEAAGGGGEPSEAAAGSEAAPAPEGPTLRIRGQDFSESATIAQVYGQYLQGLDYDVEIQTPAGFRTEAVAGLENDEIDLIVDYIGGSQTELAPDTETSDDPDEVMEVITPAYEEIGATVLDYSSAVDGDALVVRGDSEAATISDLAGMDLVFGASAQCFERPQCFLGYTDPDVYGIEFADTVTLEFGPLLGEGLSAGEVDAVVWNTTAPQIEEAGFKILEDDKGLHPAQNIAPIVMTEVLDAYGDTLREDLNSLSETITTEDLVAWNVQTDIEQREPDDVAAEWLEAAQLN